MEVMLYPTHIATRTSRPVFVGSAINRSGTTAVQRLLNSDPSMIMFGEDDYFFRSASSCYQRATRLSGLTKEIEAQQEIFKIDPTGSWMAGPLPEYNDYVSAMSRGFYEFATVYRNSAVTNGYQRWGIKKPSQEAEAYLVAQRMFPGSVIIYLERDIVEVLASSKAYLDGKNYDVERHCRYWLDQMIAWYPRRNASYVATLNYRALGRTGWVEALGAFTDLSLDAKVMKTKTNSADGYVAPEELSPEERKLGEDTRARYFDAVGIDDYAPTVIAGAEF